MCIHMRLPGSFGEVSYCPCRCLVFTKTKPQPQERKGRAIVDIDDHHDKPPQSKCSVLMVERVISEQSNIGIYEKRLLRSAVLAVETTL